MSITIGTTLGVNESQLQAMLTGQFKEATRLEGWEAFKKLLYKITQSPARDELRG